jgi:hypothetical protein
VRDLAAFLLNAVLTGVDRLLPGSTRREARRALLWAALDASAYPASADYRRELNQAAEAWRSAVGYPGPGALRWWRW